MKKLTALILSMLLLCLCGCDTKKGDTDKTGITVISTCFAAYDFAKQLAGNCAESELLIPPGTESHSYEPTPKDILRLESCDLFVYVGGESESWVTAMLSSLENQPETLRLMDVVELRHEETLEGMQEHEDEHGDEHGDEHDHEGEEYDEHIWTSPANASLITQAICDSLCKIDKKNCDTYRKASDSYRAELDKLGSDFKAYFAENKKPLVFGDRFPLLYFAREYGLTCYAAFPGCSAQTEPSAATISFLIDKVKSESISTVYYIEFSTHLAADAIAEATGAKTALFHTCHNVSGDEIKNGATYIGLMRANLETLKSS